MDPQLLAGALQLTGERTLPGIWHENYWFRRHEAVYRWLLPRLLELGPGVVVDAGCGEGYGTALLAAGCAATVLAVDYDASTAQHVRTTYPGTPVLRANLVALPLATDSVDALASLQTIEHLWDQGVFVAECARVLRPGGLLAVSTPNRLTFSPGVPRGGKPLNPFHVNELDPHELVELLARRISVEAVLGVHEGDRLRAWRAEKGDVVGALLARSYDRWDDDLASLVMGLTADDFTVSETEVDASLDLVVLGRAR